MIPLDYAMLALAILIVVWVLLGTAFPSLLTQVSLLALFFVFLAVVMAVLFGTTLLATDLLYSGTLSFVRVTDLLLFLALGAALSALFMLFMEGPVVGILKRLGMSGAWAEIGFAFVHGLATALLLVLVARLATGVELVLGGALAAGLISALGFHLTELTLIYSRPVDTEEMTLIDPSSEDGDED